MFMMGNVSDEAKKLVKITKEAMYEGMKAIKPWKSHIGDIGKAIQRYAHINGYSVVEEFCGHGIGMTMHEDPYVFNFKTKEDTVLIVPGMVFTIEPMLNQGTIIMMIGQFIQMMENFLLNGNILSLLQKMVWKLFQNKKSENLTFLLCRFFNIYVLF